MDTVVARPPFDRDALLARITIDPDVCFGKPCIRGHRVWVSLILDLLASGWTVPRILTEYPGLEVADVQACLIYAAELACDPFVDIQAAGRSTFYKKLPAHSKPSSVIRTSIPHRLATG